MDYERIEKRPPQQLSPKKLRSMILGEDKNQKEKGKQEEECDELEPASATLRSQSSEIRDSGESSGEICKEVDVVSVVPEGTRVHSSATLETTSDSRMKDDVNVTSRLRSPDDSSFPYSCGIDMNLSPTINEFQKSEKSSHRLPLAPFSKPAPSKWDDAQKWIASPTSNRSKNGQGSQGFGLRKAGYFGYGSRQQSIKEVVEVLDEKIVPSEEAVHTKQVDFSHVTKENVLQKYVGLEVDSYPVGESFENPVLMIKSSIEESAINLSRHDSSISIQSATAFIPPPSIARSVSMRDMGTEMTPIASQEPSRTGTPVRATTPTRSPTSSRPSTPGADAPTSSPFGPPHGVLGPLKEGLSEKELQIRTRREIMILGTQLGKMNIAAWASKEDEDKDASTSLRTLGAEQTAKCIVEARAAAWEEAEKAKYMARFKREEIKIEAWENHQKAKAEAEMRKIEVEVERMRAHSQDRLMNKLAAIQHRAEERRAAAEAKRNEQAAKTEQQAEQIRKNGRVLHSISCYQWCFSSCK